MTMADTDRAKFDGPIAAMHGFLDCYDGSKEAGMDSRFPDYSATSL